MTALTATQAVAWFRAFQVHLWGPSVHYVNPFSTMLSRPGEYYCADAVTATLLHAGIDIRPGCPGFCNVGAMYNYMWNQPANGPLGFKTITLGSELPGDVIMYFFGGRWGHVGMIRARSSRMGLLHRMYMHTIEGDTSSTKFPGSEKFAGVTTDRDRLWSDWPNGSIHIFRPTGYAAAPAPKPTPTPAPKPAPVVRPVLQLGSKSAAVRSLQKFLLADFPSYAAPITRTGGADGIFGAGTKTVVEQFQKRSGLVSDGIVGPKTWDALIKLGLKL